MTKTIIENKEKKLELVLAILSQAIEISTSSSIDIFFDFSSHTKEISIRVFLDSWKSKKLSYKNTVYIDWGNSETELLDILKYFKNIKEYINGDMEKY